MKNIFLILSGLFLTIACSRQKQYHLPDVRARYLVEVAVTPAEGTQANDALAELARLAVERLEAAGITYQSIDIDETNNTILFKLIDGPPKEPGSAVVHDLAYFQDAIIPKAKLEFWDVYRVNDPGFSAPFQQFYEEMFLFKYLEFNGQGYMSPAVFGMADTQNVAVIDSFLALPEKKALFPKDLVFVWSRVQNGKKQLFALRTHHRTAPLTGANLVDAQAAPDPQTMDVMISLEFDREGSKIWTNMTEKAAQDNNREIAFVLNDQVITTPMVMNAITEGKSAITGAFTLEEAQDLVFQLAMTKAGHQMKVLRAEAL